MCLHIPVVFQDMERGFIIHTLYSLCFLTKFAFFSFLFNTIQQLDEELKLFSFSEPLSEFDPNFPLNVQLKTLHEVALRFKKISVPLYPLLIRNDVSLPISAATAAGQTKAGQSSAPLPAEAQNSPFSDYLSIIQDILFTFNCKNSSDRKPFQFKRPFYQKYYSAYLSNLDVSVDPAMIHFYEKNAQTSIGKNHSMEKDREDSFFILQWALPTLLKYLPLDQIILALGCAMTEMKVIVKHKDLHVVSSVIFALIHLLRPLKWCSPVIVTLPHQLEDLIGSCLLVLFHFS